NPPAPIQLPGRRRKAVRQRQEIGRPRRTARRVSNAGGAETLTGPPRGAPSKALCRWRHPTPEAIPAHNPTGLFHRAIPTLSRAGRSSPNGRSGTRAHVARSKEPGGRRAWSRRCTARATPTDSLVVRRRSGLVSPPNRGVIVNLKEIVRYAPEPA